MVVYAVLSHLLFEIYALLSVKFPHLKLQLCKKVTNMRYARKLRHVRPPSDSLTQKHVVRLEMP